VVGHLSARDSMKGTMGGGLLYWGTRKMRFLRDLQDFLSVHGGPVGEPGGGSSAGTLRD
jgi:hypothetical protein